MTKKGIDVSKWQGQINWPKVKESGIEFAMIRLGYGSAAGSKGITDSYFAINMEGAKAAGIDTGVYFYSYALSAEAAEQEARFVLQELLPYQQQIVYPVAYDLEDEKQKGLGKDSLTEMVIAYCSAIRKEGYESAFYCNLDWCHHRLKMEALQDYDLWLAQWGTTVSPEYPHTIWQFTDSGKVSGITGPVDMNIACKDYAALKKQKT